MSRWRLPALIVLPLAITATAGFLIDRADDGDNVELPPIAVLTPADTAPTPTPSTTPDLSSPRLNQARLHLNVPSHFAGRVHSQAQAVAAEMGIVLVSTAAAGDDGVSVGPVTDDAGHTAVVERWVAVASMWSRQESISLTSGLETPLYLPEEWRSPLESLLAESTALADARWLPWAEIGPALAADLTAAALVPLSEPTAGMRTLSMEPGGRPWLEQRLGVTWADPELEAFGSSLTERLTVEAPPLTTLRFTGDVIPARCVYERQRSLGDFTAAFEHVKPYLNAADITVGSLDASISDAGEPFLCEETFNLLAPPESVEGLVAAGFDVLNVATNHAKDCGKTGFGCSEAMVDTLAYLQDAGIATAGGGDTLSQANQPAIIERNGVRFAFLGYDEVASAFYAAGQETPGTAPLTEEAIRAGIAEAKKLADVVIVLPHWGSEYTATPSARQLQLGRAAIEAGATLVVGNHPHVVQGVEAGAASLIAYALGNFVFDQDWSLETQQGAVLEATFAGDRLLSVSLKPVRIVNMFQPTFAESLEGGAILDRMRQSSDALAER